MSTLAEIEAAIEKLQPDEFAELAVWMVTLRRSRKMKGKVFTHHAPLPMKLAP